MKKKIVIFGSEGRIGKVISKHLESAHQVIRADITLKDDKNGYGLSLLDEEKLNRTLEKINSESPIDAIINVTYPKSPSAGKKIQDLTYAAFSENMNVHLGGYFNAFQAATRLFSKNERGHLISFSSIYGVVTPKFEIYENTDMTCSLEYNLIKSSIIMMNQYYAKKFAKQGMRFNCISPGGILDSQPAVFQENYKKKCNSKGMIGPEDLVGVVDLLVSDSSQFINGQNFVVDDGFTL